MDEGGLVQFPAQVQVQVQAQAQVQVQAQVRTSYHPVFERDSRNKCGMIGGREVRVCLISASPKQGLSMRVLRFAV